MLRGVSWAAWLALAGTAPAQDGLPGTQILTGSGDRSAAMVVGIGRFLEEESVRSVGQRSQWWRVDCTSREAYEKSVAPNRARLAKILGVVDARVPDPQLEYVTTASTPAKVAETDRFVAYAVRWPVFDGVHGEGLLFQPKARPVACVVALPDADQTPEMIAGLAPGLPAAGHYARRLAENGCAVLVPTPIDRSDAFSGSPRLGRMTNQPGREWIYRPAFELGRHVIGYEIQKIMAAVDCLARDPAVQRAPIGVVGWGEGGLLAFTSAALDPRIDAALVSGYFAPREKLWQEPIYRNVFGLLREFGDAEIARLIVPRTLLIEPSAMPVVNGPPAPRPRVTGAAPGRIVTPPAGEVRAEVQRAITLAGPFASSIELTAGDEPGPLGARVLMRFLRALGGSGALAAADDAAPVDFRVNFDPAERQRRQVVELEAFTQRLLPLSHGVRENFLWKKTAVTTPTAWQEAMRPFREQFSRDVIGRVAAPRVALNPRSRRIADRPAWTGYEIVLDVAPDVFAWGYLLLPKGIAPGEKRPVVVVQHGLEGVPADTMDEDPKSRAFGFYKAFGARLAERGFIVFAPHNPYRGEDAFRLLQRKANPLGLSLFSIIVAQHEAILDWLATQPAVDPARIGFYGLSYGGKTAMRVPAIVERYALSICSGDFNEWIWKNVTTGWPGGYPFTKEWEMPEFDLGSTFGYAEMAALIAPRPFMVERGHDDGVGLDEWVAFEYAKVNRLYVRLKIPERTRIEFFPGPHTINGVGTFQFLHQHLGWPEPAR